MSSAEYELCVVPGCMVWSRKLTRWGMCPRYLWDERHDAYALKVSRRIA